MHLSRPLVTIGVIAVALNIFRKRRRGWALENARQDPYPGLMGPPKYRR